MWLLSLMYTQSIYLPCFVCSYIFIQEVCLSFCYTKIPYLKVQTTIQICNTLRESAMMNRLSIAIALLHTLALSCGSTAVTAASSTSSTQQDERQLIFNNPLLDNWEKEEGLANLLNEMIESSKTTSPSLSPTTSPTNNPTNVSWMDKAGSMYQYIPYDVDAHISCPHFYKLMWTESNNPITNIISQWNTQSNPFIKSII